jgi:hypothetical protein
LKRLFEGAPSRDDEFSLMSESIADLFTVQVTGGSNYVHPYGTVDRFSWWDSLDRASIGWCTSSPCMDYNYNASGDYNTNRPFNDEAARYHGILYDAFDRADSSSRFTNEIANGDYLKLEEYPWAPPRVAPAENAFVANDDEPVNLPGTAWKDLVHNWLKRGKMLNKKSVLGGLVETMSDSGYSWCDQCEVFAPHYAIDVENDRMKNPTGLTRTLDMRQRRWKSCMKTGEMSSLLGKAPEKYGNFDATCKACPPLHHPDASGTCVACPPNHIPRGIGECQECPEGSIALPNNECQACPGNQITVGNTCVPCPFGQGADKVNNVCVACPADASVTLTSTIGDCSQGTIVWLDYFGAPYDLCPEDFWLDVSNLSVIDPTLAALTVRVSADSEGYWPDLSQSECSSARAKVSAFSDATGASLGANGAAPFFDPAAVLVPKCQGAAEIVVPYTSVQGMTKLRIHARLEVSGEPTAGAVVLSTSGCSIIMQ